MAGSWFDPRCTHRKLPWKTGFLVICQKAGDHRTFAPPEERRAGAWQRLVPRGRRTPAPRLALLPAAGEVGHEELRPAVAPGEVELRRAHRRPPVGEGEHTVRRA